MRLTVSMLMAGLGLGHLRLCEWACAGGGATLEPIIGTPTAGGASVGMKCTRCARGSPTKHVLALCGGVCFVCAGLLSLITVCWTTNDVIVEFYNPSVPSGMKYEIGLAVYLGYASSCMSLTGGSVLCWNSGGGRPRNPLPRRRHRHRRPPAPPALSNIKTPAPPYKPPAALKGNHTASRTSPSLFHSVIAFQPRILSL